MATERQIAANRRNSTRSTGPKTPEGKARSRANATKHGMAGESPELEATLSPEFVERRAKWSKNHEPADEAASWALDKAVAASLRIDRCERAVEGLARLERQKAALTWDQDRALQAAEVAAGLAREPVVASRRLQTTLAGVVLLLELWERLVATLANGEDWSESEASRALDLLGTPVDLRAGQTAIDAAEGDDLIAFRMMLALDEIERLETLRDEALAPLDETERNLAMAGDVALLSKPIKLVLRYERDAWRRYRESIKQVQAPATPPPPPPPLPMPAPVKTTPSRTTEPNQAFEAERRALLEAASPVLALAGEHLATLDLDEDQESAFIAEFERRIERMRSRSIDIPIG